MTALATARITDSKWTGNVKSYPLAADIAYYGGLAAINSSGYVEPAGASSNQLGCVGVFQETVDNSAGSAGDKSVKVVDGLFNLGGSTLGQDDVGKWVFADDDQTVDETPAIGQCVAGKLLEYVGASEAWVAVGPQYLPRRSYTTLTYRYNLAEFADGDMITDIVPGVQGFIKKFFAAACVVASTASKTTALHWEIGAVATTGGVLTLTTANQDTLGKKVDASAITAANYFGVTDTLSLVAASTTTFVEGATFLHTVLELFGE